MVCRIWDILKIITQTQKISSGDKNISIQAGDELEIKSYLVQVNCFLENGEKFGREFIVKAINEEEATRNVLNDCTLGLGHYSYKIINVELY